MSSGSLKAAKVEEAQGQDPQRVRREHSYNDKWDLLIAQIISKCH